MAIHKILVLNGMTNVVDADLNGFGISFLNNQAVTVNGVIVAPNGGGIVGANDYMVLQNGATPSNPTGGSATMQVTVWSGRAWLPNNSTPPTNMYGTYNDTPLSVTIANNSSGQPRVDYLILYLNLSATPTATGSNIPQLADAQGPVDGSHNPPTATQIINGTSGTTWTGIGAGNPYLILAQIGQSPNYIPSGVGSITSTMISSLRNFAFVTTGQTISVPQYEEFTDQLTAPSNPTTGKTRLFTINSNMFLRQPTGPIIQIGATSLVNNGNAGATPSVDWTQGSTQAYTLNTTNTVFTFNNPVPGGKYVLFLTQAAGGNFTVAGNGWPNVRWSNGIAPVLSTAAGKIDVVGLIWNNIINQYIGFYQLGF